MGLSFHWQNLVLLTRRTSIPKLLKPNFLYQAPETSTNFHRIIHFFPLKKKKAKRKTLRVPSQREARDRAAQPGSACLRVCC